MQANACPVVTRGVHAEHDGTRPKIDVARQAKEFRWVFEDARRILLQGFQVGEHREVIGDKEVVYSRQVGNYSDENDGEKDAGTSHQIQSVCCHLSLSARRAASQSQRSTGSS